MKYYNASNLPRAAVSLMLMVSCCLPATVWAEPVVVTTIHPLALIVSEVAGEEVEIRQLLPDADLPHHFSLGISHKRLLQSAELAVWIGPELESFLDKAMAARGPGTVITSTALQSIQWPSIDNGDRQGQHGPATARDPHIWLNPENGLAIAREVAGWLGNRYPDRAQTMNDRVAALARDLEQLSADIGQLLGSADVKPFIADHDAYRHFAAHFGIPQAGALQATSGLDKGLKSYLSLMEYQGAGCVVVEPRYNSPRLARLAATLQVPIIEVDALGSTIGPGQGAYARLLLAVAEQFVKCNGKLQPNEAGG